MSSNTCQFVKQNNDACKRSVAIGHKFCWQHSHGLRAKWHSLTRRQTVEFYIGAASLAATLWFGIRGILPPHQAVHVQSSGGQSPNIVNNEGKVEIHNQQSKTQEQGSGKSSAEPKQ